MKAVIVIALGFVFGFVLQKCGLGHYATIVNQFRFKDATMVRFMFAAIAVGAVGVLAMQAAGSWDPGTVPYGLLAAAAVGGALLGVGMAVAGTCPGTILAGIGQGNIDYLVPGFVGMLVGGLIYGLAYDPISAAFEGLWPTYDLTLAELLGVPAAAVVAVIVTGVLALYIVSRRAAKG